MNLKNLTVLIIIMIMLQKVLTLTDKEKNIKWRNETLKEVRCFCGKKIPGRYEKKNSIKNIQESDIETIIRNLKQRYNEIIKEEKNFPKIGTLSKGFFFASENQINSEAALFHSFRANYDFFTLFIYFSKLKNNVKLIFSLKPHKFDAFSIVTNKFNYLSQSKGNYYSYLFPSFEGMINETKLTSGFYEKKISLSIFQNTNFRNEMCVNFFIFLNKITGVWVKENKKLKEERLTFKIDNLVLEKKKFKENVNYEDFRSMISDMNGKKGICLQGKVFSYLSLVSPENIIGERDHVEVNREKLEKEFYKENKDLISEVNEKNKALDEKIEQNNFLNFNKNNLEFIRRNSLDFKKKIELEKVALKNEKNKLNKLKKKIKTKKNIVEMNKALINKNKKDFNPVQNKNEKNFKLVVKKNENYLKPVLKKNGKDLKPVSKKKDDLNKKFDSNLINKKNPLKSQNEVTKKIKKDDFSNKTKSVEKNKVIDDKGKGIKVEISNKGKNQITKKIKEDDFSDETKSVERNNLIDDNGKGIKIEISDISYSEEYNAPQNLAEGSKSNNISYQITSTASLENLQHNLIEDKYKNISYQNTSTSSVDNLALKNTGDKYKNISYQNTSDSEIEENLKNKLNGIDPLSENIYINTESTSASSHQSLENKQIEEINDYKKKTTFINPLKGPLNKSLEELEAPINKTILNNNLDSGLKKEIVKEIPVIKNLDSKIKKDKKEKSTEKNVSPIIDEIKIIENLEKKDEKENLSDDSKKDLYENLISDEDQIYEINNYKSLKNQDEISEIETLKESFLIMKKDGLTRIKKNNDYKILIALNLKNIKDTTINLEVDKISHIGSIDFPALKIEDLEDLESDKKNDRIKLEKEIEDVLLRDLLTGILDKNHIVRLIHNRKEKFKANFYENQQNIVLVKRMDILNSDINISFLGLINSFNKAKLTRRDKTIILNRLKSEIMTFDPLNNKDIYLKTIYDLSAEEFLNFLLNEREKFLRMNKFIINFLKFLMENEFIIQKIISDYNTFKNKSQKKIEEDLKIIIYNDLSIDIKWEFFHFALKKFFLEENYIYEKKLVYVQEKHEQFIRDKNLESVTVEKISINENFGSEVNAFILPEVNPGVDDTFIRGSQIKVIKEISI